MPLEKLMMGMEAMSCVVLHSVIFDWNDLEVSEYELGYHGLPFQQQACGERGECGE